ncbi:MAG: hypothetical protein ACRDKF_16900 [Actinomycetota bacterium]
MHLLLTELLKLRTTRLWWGLGLALLGLTALGGILTLVFTTGDTPGFQLSGETAQRSLFGTGGFCTIFALVFGVIGMAGEYRQGTVTPTFLAAPVRWRIVATKAVAYGIAGLLFGAAATLLAALVAYAGLAIKGFEVVLSGSDLSTILGGTTASAAIFGVLGVGIGALIPNQIAALIAALVEQLVVEPLLFGFFPEQGRFLVGGASSILSGAPNTGATLSLWAAAAVLLAWCAAMLVGGTVITERKDIT